jgi:hypothetical protein
VIFSEGGLSAYLNLNMEILALTLKATASPRADKIKRTALLSAVNQGVNSSNIFGLF